MKGKYPAEIIENNEIAPGIFDMRARVECAPPRPGQFFMLYTGDSARLLPRPISVGGYEKGILRLVYRVAGTGTALFSEMDKSNRIEVLGPLGNGYPIDFTGDAVLIGGGIGLPPLLYLGQILRRSDPDKPRKLTSILGYRDSQKFLADEFGEISDLHISTDDGSLGTKGTVMDLIAAHPELINENSVIFACGPTPMLKAIQKYAAERNLKCYISLEERMACGVGACLSCVCRTTERNEHSNVFNARVCVDGPVFSAEEVELC